MRRIQTFVIRVFVDTAELPALKGAIRCVSSGQEDTFSDGPALLALLEQMSRGTGAASSGAMDGCPAQKSPSRLPEIAAQDVGYLGLSSPHGGGPGLLGERDVNKEDPHDEEKGQRSL